MINNIKDKIAEIYKYFIIDYKKLKKILKKIHLKMLLYIVNI